MGTWGYVFFGLAVAYIAYIKYLGYRSPEQVREMADAVENGAILLDVRTPGEFGMGHIPGAINVPLHELPQRQKDIGSTKKAVVVYCRSGNRSRSALGILQNMGFSKIMDLGAMGNWNKKGNNS